MTQSLTYYILLLLCICCRLMLISVVVLIDVLYAVGILLTFLCQLGNHIIRWFTSGAGVGQNCI